MRAISSYAVVGGPHYRCHSHFQLRLFLGSLLLLSSFSADAVYEGWRRRDYSHSHTRRFISHAQVIKLIALCYISRLLKFHFSYLRVRMLSLLPTVHTCLRRGSPTTRALEFRAYFSGR